MKRIFLVSPIYILTLSFCPLKADGMVFPEGVVPPEFLPQACETTTLNDRKAVYAKFPTLKIQQMKESKRAPAKQAVQHRKINVARSSSHRISNM